MGVTIDNLQIEIQTSSTNAASGIDALAKSLGELKKNGAFKTVTTNLSHLSDALQKLPNVHQASNSLRTLANSIEKLKGVGTVAGLSNSLKKLPDALKAIEKLDIDRVAPQIQRVADAAQPLSSLKAGGLTSMVNAMSKLGKVTESLDDKTIGEFAKKVELLNQKLGPLSEKMTTIKAGFSAISSGARSAGKSVEDFGSDVNASTLNLSSFIDIAQTAVDTIQNIIQGFSDLISEAIEWDGIAARFGRGFGAQAQETYAWVQRLNEEMGINIQEFMKYSSVYSTMLTGFGVAAEDAGKMAVGYMELTYDIWAGYNDVYGSLEEAAEAVKSAIAGEVEPIRRAGFTIVESTLEQTAKNHGLEVSLYNATEAQKSYLRYLTLVDQAHAQNLVGTYAKELNTAEGLMRTFAQQLKSLTQAFGSLFLPILVRVMPYLQAFVELLTDAVYWAANLFGVDIQPVDWGGYNSGVTDVVKNTEGVTGAFNDATAAAKELKNATIGIDELNVISPSSATGGSGGSGGGSGAGDNGFSGLDIDSLWNKSIFDGIQSNVDEIKDKLKDWMPVLGGIGTALAGLKLTKLLDDISIADFKLANIGKAISVAGISIAVGKLVWDFTGAYLEGGNEADLLKALGTTALGVALAGWLAGKPGAAFTLLVSGVVTLSRLSVEIAEGDVEWNDTESLVTGLIGGLETAIGGYFTWKTFSPMIKKAWPKIVSAATPVLSAAAPYIAPVAAIVGGIILAFVDYDFTEMGRTVGEKIGEALSNLGEWIKTGFDNALEWLKETLDIDDVWDVLAVLFVPGEWIKRLGKVIDDIFWEIDKWINEKIENLQENINEFFGGFFEGLFDGLGVDMSWAEKITEFFDIEYLDIVDMVMNPASIGEHIITGIKNGLKITGISDRIGELLDDAKKFIEEKKIEFMALVDALLPDWLKFGKDTGANLSKGVSEGLDGEDKTLGQKLISWGGNVFSTVKSFFGINSPSTLFRDEIGKNLTTGLTNGMGVNGIKDKLSTMWTNAKNWWNDKKGSLKSYTPSIGSIYDNLKARWDNAKEWWNNKKTAMKSYTPSIGSIYEKAKERWDNARTWWNSKKSAMNTYTPSIGSIVDKVKSAWNTAKKWWNSNVSLSTKLNIKVPKIKVNWATASAFGKEFKYPTGFKLEFAANGGIFDQGSLIWAGERGPEVMATAAGGKTGVMNVQQMQDAVYEGVYAAISAAMRGSGESGSQAVNVYLDGRQITAAVEQRQRERGASIMGKEVYSY